MEHYVRDNVYVLNDFRQPYGKPLREAFGAIQLLVRNSDGSWTSIVRLSPRAIGQFRSSSELVETIRSEVARKPALLREDGEWVLSIPPLGPSGFAISLYGLGAAVRGSFGELEDEFASLEEALPWVQKAVSDAYQLTTVSIGNVTLECRLEHISNADAPILAMGHPVPFKRYRRKKISTKRNSLVYRL